MEIEAVERLKRHYTDNYVVADSRRPELRRFQGMTGQVKTVNMNGRALVQFDGHNNIGWYDIDPAALHIVEAPPPKEEKKRPAKASPAEKPAPKTVPDQGSAAAVSPPADSAPAPPVAPPAAPGDAPSS